VSLYSQIVFRILAETSPIHWKHWIIIINSASCNITIHSHNEIYLDTANISDPCH